MTFKRGDIVKINCAHLKGLHGLYGTVKDMTDSSSIHVDYFQPTTYGGAIRTWHYWREEHLILIARADGPNVTGLQSSGDTPLPAQD